MHLYISIFPYMCECNGVCICMVCVFITAKQYREKKTCGHNILTMLSTVEKFELNSQNFFEFLSILSIHYYFYTSFMSVTFSHLNFKMKVWFLKLKILFGSFNHIACLHKEASFLSSKYLNANNPSVAISRHNKSQTKKLLWWLK